MLCFVKKSQLYLITAKQNGLENIGCLIIIVLIFYDCPDYLSGLCIKCFIYLYIMM